MHSRAHHSRKRRDLTGWFGSGLGVLNSIDQDVPINKLSTVTSDLGKLEVPLRSSLITLAESQQLTADLISLLPNHTSQDFQAVASSVEGPQGNVSIAIQWVQTQLWIQSVVSDIIREGMSGNLPQEIREIMAENDTTNSFELKHQAWWQLVNFTYDDTKEQIEAYVFTIQKAEVWAIFPILALGAIHQDVVVRPIGHDVWAKYSNNTGKQQTISTEACIPKEQLGYLCENAVIENKDLCLETEDSTCTFGMLPSGHAQSQVCYVGKGCACIRTSCANVSIDTCEEERNGTNFCVCNFTKIRGCDFNYSVPITTSQLISDS